MTYYRCFCLLEQNVSEFRNLLRNLDLGSSGTSRYTSVIHVTNLHMLLCLVKYMENCIIQLQIFFTARMDNLWLPSASHLPHPTWPMVRVSGSCSSTFEGLSLPHRMHSVFENAQLRANASQSMNDRAKECGLLS